MNRSKKELVIRGKGEKTHMNDGIERRRPNILLPTISPSDSSVPLPSRIVVAREDLTADRHGNVTHEVVAWPWQQGPASRIPPAR
jgi:hypothetical protein